METPRRQIETNQLATQATIQTIPDPPSVRVANSEIAIFQELIHLIESNGYVNVYVVGGWVRDKLKGIDSKDIDIVCPEDSLEPLIQQLTISFKNDIRCKLEAPFSMHRIEEYPLVGVPVHSAVVFDSFTKTTRVIALRKLDGETIHDDSLTRDFTINAIYFNPVNNQLLDPVNGIADLRNSILKTIGAIEMTFYKCPTRFFRLISQLAKYNLKPERKLEIYLQNVDFYDEVYLRYKDTLRNTLRLGVRKIFKDKLCAAILEKGNQIGFCDFFRLGVRHDRKEFADIFEEVVPIIKLVDKHLLTHGLRLRERYCNGHLPANFYLNARIFTTSLTVYYYDIEWTQQFLKDIGGFPEKHVEEILEYFAQLTEDIDNNIFNFKVVNEDNLRKLSIDDTKWTFQLIALALKEFLNKQDNDNLRYF